MKTGRLEDLLQASAAHEELAEEDRAELNTILRSSSEARDFAAEFLATDALLGGALAIGEAKQGFVARRRSRRNWMAAAAAALVVLGLSIQLWKATPDSAPAALVQSANRPAGVSPGDGLRPGEWLRFEKGRVAMRFQSGAKLAIEGPAEFQITGSNGAKMVRGRATIRVPGEIKGFTLDTPSEQVVDLGTSFGVDVADDGSTSIAVFEGEIELRGEQHLDGPQRLHAGTSVLVADRSQAPAPIPYETTDYLATWQASFGVVAIEGDLRVATPIERAIPGKVVDVDHLLLFPEREAVEVSGEMTLSSTEPGVFNNEGKPRPLMQKVKMGASRQVDSYLLQFNPGGELHGEETRRFQGSLRFDRPIVGLLLRPEMLDGTDSILGLQGVDFGDVFRRGINSGDEVVLDTDRRTLHISFDINDGVDQVRVLVASDEDTK